MDNEVIFEYTITQAEEDGILTDIRKLNDNWKDGLFSHITTNLLETHNYIKNDEANVVNIGEILSQCLYIVKKKSNNFTEFDHFFNGIIETPYGKKVKVFICQNEINKFTIMLPEDY